METNKRIQIWWAYITKKDNKWIHYNNVWYLFQEEGRWYCVNVFYNWYNIFDTFAKEQNYKLKTWEDYFWDLMFTRIVKDWTKQHIKVWSLYRSLDWVYNFNIFNNHYEVYTLKQLENKSIEIYNDWI